MTDAEIIKALECCTSDEVGMCHICPLDGGCNGDITILLNCSLDLINRQKEEIERLKNNVFCKVVINEETMRNIVKEKVAEFELDIASIKAEAIKEFAERIKAEFNNVVKYEFDCRYYYLVSHSFIDRLAEEMVGDTE